MENKAHHEPSKLSYQVLKQITNDFDKERILGSGGFGTVYKGVHENRGEMAVKVLRNISGLDDKEFRKEFNNLRGLKHPNIVELVGFCNETENELAMFEGKQVTAECLRMALCFEYVQNGSLNKLISDEKKGLTWHTRYRIIKGICEGLKYLREGLEYPIMHFDLKPDNILIDKGMTPKIADFGLSKLFGEENTRKTMSTAGTCGYWPPEYIKHQIISREFDIFSLGVIIVRIMAGHEHYNSIVEMPTRKSVKLVHERWKKQLLRSTLSHTSLEVQCNQVKRCIEIALNCLISNRQERPTIQDIVSSLNETETMIGDQEMQNEQFYQVVGESTLVSSIAINYEPSPDNFPAAEPRLMSLSLLQELTDNFSTERIIGEGRRTTVYKGVHRDGEVIAVKRIRQSHIVIDDAVHNEIAFLEKLHHPNIVRFTGYCRDTKHAAIENPEGGGYIYAEKTETVLCFEYFRNGSLEHYISEGMESALDWQTRYKILRGICDGLKYLDMGFQSPIIHMNLKPSNIFLDENMMPRIGDFACARYVSSSFATGRFVGTIEYMPPEFIHRQIISYKYDMFSFGAIALELMTGRQLYRHEFHEMPRQEFFELAHAKLRGELHKTVDVTLVEGYCEQARRWLEIAVRCVDYDRDKRLSPREIINILNETEILIPQIKIGPVSKLDSEDSELLLQIHPLELCFLAAMSSSMELPRKKKADMMSSSCSLQLNNKGNDRVAFMLVANSPKRYLTKEPLCGVVLPRCSYTLTLTMRHNKKQPPSLSLGSGGDDFFTLYSVGLEEYDLLNVDKDSITEKYDTFFKKAKEEVQEVKLSVVCGRPTSDQRTSSSELIVTTADAQQVSSIDVHPTEPWIMTTNHMGSLRVWNYKTVATLSCFELAAYEPVHIAKFITREKWVVAGDRDGDIIVYNYENEDVESFDAHDSCITALVVHATSPFVLSSSEDDDHQIKLWDWGNGWKCTREFEGHTGRVTQLTFNLENSDNFASASLDGTVKVWSICSDDPRNVITLKLDEHGLCTDYFIRDNRQHLIVGCKDRTAQIWELGMKGRVQELEGHEDRIGVVSLHPELPLLITGSLDGTIRVWDSTTYKLENIIGFNLGAVYAFGCIKGSRRIVVGCHEGIAIIEIPRP